MNNTGQEAAIKLFLSVLGIFYLVVVPFDHLKKI